MEEIEIAHLAGYIDGSASITVHVNESDDYSVGYHFKPVVVIYVPRRDETMLGKLDAYCEDNFVQYAADEREGKENDSVRWSVFEGDNIKRFLEPMLPYLVSRYHDANVMVEKIVPAVEDGEHREKRGLYELMEFADELRQSNRKGTDPKYTQEYFADEWDDEVTA